MLNSIRKIYFGLLKIQERFFNKLSTTLPAKSDNDDMFSLQSYQELVIDKYLMY